MRHDTPERTTPTVAAPVIETERLQLRLLAERDIEAWAAFYADPEATELLHDKGTHARDHAEVLLGWAISHAEGPLGLYTVLLRQSGETVGFVGYRRRRCDWGDELELAWLLLRAHHRRGYAIEAARALRPLARGRVVSLIRAENERSKNVARKLGMTLERTITYLGYTTELYASEYPPILLQPTRGGLTRET